MVKYKAYLHVGRHFAKAMADIRGLHNSEHIYHEARAKIEDEVIVMVSKRLSEFGMIRTPVTYSTGNPILSDSLLLLCLIIFDQ